MGCRRYANPRLKVMGCHRTSPNAPHGFSRGFAYLQQPTNLFVGHYEKSKPLIVMKKLLFGICLLFSAFQAKTQFCHPFESNQQYAGNRPPGCQLVGPIYQGSTIGFTAEVVTDEMFPCGTVENNQFISFVADSSMAQVTVLASSCRDAQGIEYTIFDSSFSVVSHCFSGGSFPGSILAINLTAGEIYFIMIDGYAGDECDILLTSAGVSIPTITNIQDSLKIIREHSIDPYCPNSQSCFSIKKVENATGYQWTIPNSVQLLSGGTNQDTFACVQFSETPFQVIGVVPIFDTVYGAAASFLIEVNERITRIDTLICPGGQVTSGDSVFLKGGNFEVIIQNINALDCDSTVLLDIKMPDTSTVEVEYFYDEFIEALTFSWEDRPLADYYELTLNGEKLPNQNYVGLLLQDAIPGEEIELEVHPVGVHGCEYGTGKLSFIVPDFVNSKEQFSNVDLKILPNPSNGIFEISSDKKVLKTVVFNSSGRKMKEEFSHRDAFGGTKIDLSAFEMGVYFFKILTEEGVILKKVLKI